MTAVVLLAERVSAQCRDAVCHGTLSYRPDLAGATAPALASALAEIAPAIVVSRAGLDLASAASWRAAVPSGRLILVCESVGRDDTKGLFTHRIEVRQVTAWANADQFTLAALGTAERAWTSSATYERRPANGRSRPAGRVALVGAGIVNLVTALELVRDGHEVMVLDASPDPRKALEPDLYGCTSGGANARMFTLTEADNYNDRRYGPPETLANLLDRPPSACGWRLTGGSRSPAEHQWVAQSEGHPKWLVENHTEDILAINRESGERWEELRRAEPEIFEEVGLRDGIVRLYDDAEYFEAQVNRQGAVGALERVLSPAELFKSHPALAEARPGSIVGAIEVRGFTLAIHDFVARLLSTLEQRGARLLFDKRAHSISWKDGRVAGLETDGAIVRADHYVLSPGAYGDDLLAGTSSHGRIQGILGVWLTVPNHDPQLEHSLKVSRRGHPTEDSNITVATDLAGCPALILGAGYGWVGNNPTAADPDELEVLFRAVEDTARTLFPRAHAAAIADGTLMASRRACVRPWTSSSLGIFDQLPTVGRGRLIITGGHNTGGFAQAPAVARAVCDALQGREHPIHAMYDPNRSRMFLDRQFNVDE